MLFIKGHIYWERDLPERRYDKIYIKQKAQKIFVLTPRWIQKLTVLKTGIVKTHTKKHKWDDKW